MNIVTEALDDIYLAITRDSHIALALGWRDVRQRYRRSIIGPFWLTISMGILIGTIAIIFGGIFKQPLRDFLPFISIGMIFWTFMSTSINDGCICFSSQDAIIKQLPIPLFIHVMRMVWRNTIILMHNILLFMILIVAFKIPIGMKSLLLIPGFIIVVINICWIGIVLGVICARYRDLPQIINSALQIFFYLTPIMWMTTQFSSDSVAHGLLVFNPFFHLIEIIRAPLLSENIEALNWIVSIAIGITGSILALILFSKYKWRVPYWM